MKQMLQSKKTRTLLPLFLALLLTFLAVPFAASAEEAVTYPDELLYRLSSLDAANITVNQSGNAAANFPFDTSKGGNKSIVRGTADPADLLVSADATTSNTGAFAVNTGWKLGKSGTCTVEFFMKPGDALPDDVNLFFGFALGDPGTGSTAYYGTVTIGFAFQQDGKAISGMRAEPKPACWNLQQVSRFENSFWNTDPDKYGGYTRFVMTYTGQRISLYDENSNLLHTENCNLSVWGWDYLLLTTGVHGKYTNNIDTTVDLSKLKGQSVGKLANISVYTGALTPEQIDALYASESTPTVRFEKADGTLIEKRELVDGSLTVENFPEITSDKTVCWFNKETGELVQAGATFEKDTVLVAREFGRNETVLVGAQDGAPANNKVNARFVGGVYDLSGDQIGFDIEVTYKDADGQDVVEKYRKEGSAVYTSLIAAGESYTANQKGVMYLFALTFEEIPVMATEITFTVKPFKANGGVRLYGEAGSFTMVNGQFTDQPQA